MVRHSTSILLPIFPILCPGLPSVHPCLSLSSLASVPSGASRLRCPSPCLCHGSLKAIGHGCFGPCCGGMCPQQAPRPVTVASYLSNPDPSPAYLSSAWFSLGVSNSPVPLHLGSGNEMRGRGLCAERLELCESEYAYV